MYTRNLGLAFTVSDQEREQGRFQGSIEGAPRNPAQLLLPRPIPTRTVFTDLPFASHMESKTEIILSLLGYFQHVYMLTPRRVFPSFLHTSRLPPLLHRQHNISASLSKFSTRLSSSLCRFGVYTLKLLESKNILSGPFRVFRRSSVRIGPLRISTNSPTDTDL